MLEWLRPAGAMPLAVMDVPAVVTIRDRALKAHGWRFSRYAVAIVSLLWSWGLLHGHCRGDNPAKPVPALPRPRDLAPANRPWTASEVAAVLDAAPAGIRAAVALGAFAGLREADALALPWSAVSDGWITWRQGKTGAQIQIPVLLPLADVLAQTPRCSTIIVTGQRGRPFTPSGFRASFFRLLGRMETAGTIGSDLTFHGLRHTLATVLTEAGANARTVQDWLGHASPGMTAHYAARADTRRLMEDVARLVGAQNKEEER